MVLKTYWDGSGDADSRRYEVASLAVVSGNPHLWEPFDARWLENLKKHRAPYLHTTDAWALRGAYEGWTEKQRDDFLADCVRIAVERHAVAGAYGRYGLFCFVASIVLKDFVGHAASHPNEPQNAHESLFRQAFAETMEWCVGQGCSEVCHCYFDRNERFYGFLQHLLQSKKARIVATVLNRIGDTGEVDACLVPGMQLADLYAWCQSRRGWQAKPAWCERLLRTHFRWQWLDKGSFAKHSADNQRIWDSWGIPKRGRTR